jgi:azurin
MPAMQHNVIIVSQGSVDAMSKKALMAGTKGGWVPKDPAVLAATGLTKPGESSFVDFVLAAGTYEYFCSYPGHAAMMRGTLIIE